jgi:hypothetical protein
MEVQMPSHTALRVALLCGMIAFGWALLSSTAPPPPQTPGRAPPMPDHPDALLQWLTDGHGDTDATAWRNAGEIFHWRSEAVAAQEAWRRAARLARSSSGGWERYTLAWCLIRLGDHGAAEHVRQAIEQSRRRDSDQSPSYRRPISRAVLLQLAGEDELAADELELARLRLAATGGSTTGESLYWLARIEALEGRPEMALAALQRAADAGERVRRIGRARWAFEFGELRDDPDFQRAIDGLERSPGVVGG